MSTSNFRKCSGALVFCIVVLVIETIAAHPPKKVLEIGLANSSPAHDDGFRFMAKQALLSEQKPSIALMGSSQMREGFDAAEIESQIKQRCGLDWQVSNFGVSGGGVLELVFAMDAVGEKSPEIIVAWPTWRRFYLNEVQLNLHYYADSMLRMFELLYHFARAGELATYFSDLSPSYLAAMFPSTRWARSYRVESIIENYFLLNSTTTTDFAYARAADPKKAQRRLENYRSWSRKIQIGKLEEVHKDFFEGAVRRARQSGIEVLVIDVYNSPAHENARALTEVRNDFYQYLNSLEQRYHTRRILPDAFPQLKALEYTDHTHVNARGREKLSKYLADYLITTYIAGTHAKCE